MSGMKKVPMQPTEYRAVFVTGLGDSGEFRLIRPGDSHSSNSTQMVGYQVDASRFHLPPAVIPDRLSDTFDVLHAVYMVDCLCPRTVRADSRPVGDRWPRGLLLQLPLRDRSYWLSADTSLVLNSLSEYLTGDEWVIEPMAHTFSESGSARRLALLGDVEPRNVNVVLHSGGLDSLLGIALTHAHDPQGLTVAASACTHPHMGALQRRVIGELQRTHLGPCLATATVGYKLRHDLGNKEPSQRTRILKCIATGAMAAMALGGRRLIVAENGPGAINLPSNVLDAGPHLSRGVHPYSLQLLAELISLALGETFTIHNPLLALTKGEVVALLCELGFGPLVEMTNSRDRFPYTSARHHCGICSSCVLRSIALWHLPSTRHLTSRVSLMEPSSALAHYQMLAWRLEQALHGADPIRGLRRFDHRFDRVLVELGQGSCLAMLGRHHDEVIEFVDTSLLEAA